MSPTIPPAADTVLISIDLPRDLRDRFFAAVPEDQRDAFVAAALEAALDSAERLADAIPPERLSER